MEEFAIPVRLKEIIDKLGLSDSQFADKCGISRPTLSLLLSGKNKKISDVMLSQIHRAFPEVSILWLLFGEGEIFPKSNSEEEIRNENSENSVLSHNPTVNLENSNLIDLNQLNEVIQNAVNKGLETALGDLKLLLKKIEEPTNPRKVASVTVYYDDSTFEIFSPEQS